MVLIPTAECKFLAKWQGPYEVVDRVGEVNYRVRQQGRRKPTQLYHINLLKQWQSEAAPPAPTPLALTARLDIPVVPIGENLSPAQRQDLEEIVMQHREVFSDVPGRTRIIQHDIRTAPGITVCVPPYRVPEARRNAIHEEDRQNAPTLSHRTVMQRLVESPNLTGRFVSATTSEDSTKCRSSTPTPYPE